MSETKKPFHLAITMAGAISAGAYTAGVMDYLLEALDSWAEMRKDATNFFDTYPFLKNVNWDDFKKTPEFTELSKSEQNMEDLQKLAVRYNCVPNHDIQIEIISGASAGGMTAAIASLVFQLENKHHVKFLPEVTDPNTLKKLDEIRQNNRLYNSWVNLTDDDMVSVLLGDNDIQIAGKPVSALNSQFIRQVAERALKIDETDKLVRSEFVAEDFNLFVTLTNLEGYQKSLNIDRGGQRSETTNFGDFITYDHSDLVMFSFGTNKEKGTINVNFNQKGNEQNNQNIDILANAAVATGAFPIGLEYASFSRQAESINDNFLINQIHPDTKKLVEEGTNYLTTFIDGGMINNEPFELTDCLLKEKLKQKLKNSNNEKLKKDRDKYLEEFRQKLLKEYADGISPEEEKEKMDAAAEKWYEEEVKRQKNYTILMIDPFPSEPKSVKPKKTEQYPFDLFGIIGQLVSTAQSQLRVKTNLFREARDVNDFSCYLIAPRRRSYVKDSDGNIIPDKDSKPTAKTSDGSAAIACGLLGGFGGFLDKEFRIHDFYLGRINCQSFLRKHFRIKSDGDDSITNVVTESYNLQAKEMFQTECGKEYVPIVPEVNLLTAQTLLSTETQPPTPDDLYWKLEFPQYDLKAFQNSKDKILNRVWLIIDSMIKTNNVSWIARKYIQLGFWQAKHQIFDKLLEVVKKDLKTWELIK